MSDAFVRLIDGVIGREGGYVNHPDDRGGETIWGVTAGTARRFGYTGAMRAMTRTQAVEIYRAQYWTGPGYDRIAALSERVAEELFDTGVNMGPGVASTMLQRCLNALNRQGEDYPDIKVDGDVGPASLRSLTAFLKVRGKEGERVLLKGLNALQGERYIELAEKRQANESFVYGWLRTRVEIAA
ncbi:glycosyl hydrolase 108 family protein [Brevundimonas pondensis]|uniref:glycoside hydrolase family 108 protein n=1 Tax=Brevundimonas pondensis TaxID=2774189 RepID=UPI003207B4A3